MKRILKIFLLLLIYFLMIFKAQSQVINEDLNEILINLDLNEIELSNILNEIEYYSSNKINLLNTTSNQLSKLPFISRNLAKKIIDYAIQNKNVEFICDSFSLETIVCFIFKKCTYLEEIDENKEIKTKKKKSKQRDNLYFKNLNNIPLQKNRGIKEGKYLGSNYAINNKLLISVNEYNFGVYTDKDIGEESLLDFYSFYTEKSFSNHSVIIGNFKVNTSLGLIFGNSMALSKYYSIISMNDELKNQSKVDLSPYNLKSFRGISYSYDNIITENSNLGISVFYSNQKRSTNIDSKDNIVSFYGNNLFRTENELNKKNNAIENTVSAIFNLFSKNYSIVYSSMLLNYNHNVLNDKIEINKDKFLFLHSLGVSFKLNKIKFVNEIALNNLNLAIQSNAIIELSKGKAKFGFRYYSPEFYSPYGLNSYENTYLNNEIGTFLAYSNQINKNIKSTFILDYFETLKANYSNLMPINGIDLEVRNEIRLKYKNIINHILKYENKDAQYSMSNNLKSIEKEQKIKSKIVYKNYFEIGYSLGLRAEICYNFANSKQISSTGFIFGIDNSYSIKQNSNLIFDLSYYNTDDFASAVYYNNMFYRLSGNIKALYSKGIFARLNFRYNFLEIFTLSAQYWINNKFNEKSLSSGWGLIENNFEHYFNLGIEAMLK